ncbi:MAG: GPW/gp25 family protein [Persicimonas sp.]
MHIGFPFGLDSSGRTQKAGDAAHVRNLIEQVLFTAPGERVMRPQFGSGARHLVFEPNSKELAATTEFAVRGALQRYLGELVTINAVRVRSQDTTLRIAIQYTLNGEESPRTEQFESEI